MFSVSEEVSTHFKHLRVQLSMVHEVIVGRQVSGLEEYVSRAVEDVKGKFRLEQLTSHPLVRAYRDFFWRIGIDPTKTRPSAEALLRRVLQGKDFPRVNSLVDVYNVVSMSSLVPIAAFDADHLKGPLHMRFSRAGEVFRGIGMDVPFRLSGKEVVVEDEEKLVAIYPYRDADSSKVSEASRRVLLMACGVPGVEGSYLESTSQTLVEAVLRFCGGFLSFQQTVST
ncbi:MAG: phenylalanine--tRNA ligase beta subunit-related protein [Candidatus Caldarchaeum sp.]|nr:phenylalanine--tRNA ligase beta subunit-related protein [Candidatus Caldarchaeum sp.]MDW8360366.1 phenylalanine--tRNA ligase beta subunit-related protein [Candidatus Caldarchaeum sp.]